MVELLDCMLRGGGYHPSWDFSAPSRLPIDQKPVNMIDGEGTMPQRIRPPFADLAAVEDMVRITEAPSAIGHVASPPRVSGCVPRDFHMEMPRIEDLNGLDATWRAGLATRRDM